LLDKIDIRSRIHAVRGKQIIIDEELAELYTVETKALNQAVKRNIDRFPERFMFQLTQQEVDVLRSQIVTSKFVEKAHGGRRYLPYAFTEQGVAIFGRKLEMPEIYAHVVAVFFQVCHFRPPRTKAHAIFDKINTCAASSAVLYCGEAATKIFP